MEELILLINTCRKKLVGMSPTREPTQFQLQNCPTNSIQTPCVAPCHRECTNSHNNGEVSKFLKRTLKKSTECKRLEEITMLKCDHVQTRKHNHLFSHEIQKTATQGLHNTMKLDGDKSLRRNQESPQTTTPSNTRTHPRFHGTTP